MDLASSTDHYGFIVSNAHLNTGFTGLLRLGNYWPNKLSPGLQKVTIFSPVGFDLDQYSFGFRPSSLHVFEEIKIVVCNIEGTESLTDYVANLESRDARFSLPTALLISDGTIPLLSYGSWTISPIIWPPYSWPINAAGGLWHGRSWCCASTSQRRQVAGLLPCLNRSSERSVVAAWLILSRTSHYDPPHLSPPEGSTLPSHLYSLVHTSYSLIFFSNHKKQTRRIYLPNKKTFPSYLHLHFSLMHFSSASYKFIAPGLLTGDCYCLIPLSCGEVSAQGFVGLDSYFHRLNPPRAQ